MKMYGSQLVSFIDYKDKKIGIEYLGKDLQYTKIIIFWSNVTTYFFRFGHSLKVGQPDKCKS